MFALPDLEEVLAYRHPKVIRAYQRDFPHLRDQAENLFREALKYLWLSRKHQLDCESRPNDSALDFPFFMHEEMRDIDNMWHTFLLYTQDYTDFCRRFFGDYLHHQPDIADAVVQTNQEFGADLEKYLSYVYDQLGEETVRAWFAMHLVESGGEESVTAAVS